MIVASKNERVQPAKYCFEVQRRTPAQSLGPRGPDLMFELIADPCRTKLSQTSTSNVNKHCAFILLTVGIQESVHCFNFQHLYPVEIGSMAASAKNDDSLSAYEVLRAQRIHKNRERMSKLQRSCRISDPIIQQSTENWRRNAGALGVETSATSLQAFFKVQKKPGRRQVQMVLPSRRSW